MTGERASHMGRRLFSAPRTSPPTSPMRCSFRTHLFSWMRFPGRCPGLVCLAPFRANGTMAFHPATVSTTVSTTVSCHRVLPPCPATLSCHSVLPLCPPPCTPPCTTPCPIPDPIPDPHRGSNSHAKTTVPTPCPERASHTSPGCQPWESTRKNRSAF